MRIGNSVLRPTVNSILPRQSWAGKRYSGSQFNAALLGLRINLGGTNTGWIQQAMTGHFCCIAFLPQPPPPTSAIPFAHATVRLDRMNGPAPKASFCVSNNTRMFRQAAQFVGFDPVFLGFAVVGGAFAGGQTPCLFENPLLSKKISAFERAVFVCCSEDQPVSEVQRKHLRLVPSKGRNERGRGLRCGNHRSTSLANHIHAVVVAHAVLACGHETLGFISP